MTISSRQKFLQRLDDRESRTALVADEKALGATSGLIPREAFYVLDSFESPLRIVEIAVPNCAGKIGITFCPGMKAGAVDRDLDTDVQAIREWDAQAVLTLLESTELESLQVSALPDLIQRAGMQWFHLPIVDFSIPDARFESKWSTIASNFRSILERGGRLLIHCQAGLGRSGMIAARLLVECGADPDEAIATVRNRRPGAIVTRQQEDYVRNCRQMNR